MVIIAPLNIMKQGMKVMADNDSFELAEPDRPSVKPSIPIFEDHESTASSPNLQTKQTPLRDDIQPWTRFRESSSDFVRMAVAGLSTIILAWLFSGWSTIHLAGWICVAGTAVVAITAYPLIVGLERPVRMSPERAVRDYFESLEHHGPLYRRMWIFLTPEAQNCQSFADFDSFKLYWNQRAQEWRHRGNAWPRTPVVISFDQFQSKQDASDPNKSLLKFSISVSLRGHRSSGPVASYKLSWTAFRGPDRQWYLADGNLPEVQSSVELEG
jgi:hypothetical protein